MLIRNVFKKFNNNIRRNYCSCPEENNLLSTTIKVNIFTLILTGGINNMIRAHHNAMENKLNGLEKKIDELNNKDKIIKK